VHDLAVSRADLDRRHPLRFGEVGRNVEVLVLDGAVGWQLVVLLHLQDDVRRAGAPAVGELGSRGQQRRIALRCAAVCPGDQRCALRIGDHPLVVKRARRRVGMPRRHVPLAHLVPDRLGPRPGVVIGQERHGGDFPRSMTTRTVLENDRSHVFGEGRGVLVRCSPRGILAFRRDAAHGRNPDERYRDDSFFHAHTTPMERVDDPPAGSVRGGIHCRASLLTMGRSNRLPPHD
jgi:hypothetical protein